MTDQGVVARLLGAWSLRSWYYEAPDGVRTYPLGEDAVGQLMYDRAGHVSAQMMRQGVPTFASPNWRQATPVEMTSAWPEYFGYFGTYTVDTDRSEVIHHVNGSWFPNHVGTNLVRRYTLIANELALDANTGSDIARLVWRKLG